MAQDQGKVLDDGVGSLIQHLVIGGEEPLRVNKPETNLLERQSRKSLGADALPRLPWATS